MTARRAPSQTSTLACCPCNMHWGCWMLFGTYTPRQVNLPTQPPQAHPEPELICALSVTAWSQLLAQRQCGQCHLSSSRILPSRLSFNLHASTPSQLSTQQGCQVGSAQLTSKICQALSFHISCWAYSLAQAFESARQYCHGSLLG